MNDRLPGSSQSNPIIYRNYEIALCHCGGYDVMGHGYEYCFAHESYDGAPDSNDHRNGHAPTVEAAKREIDAQIEDRK